MRAEKENARGSDDRLGYSVSTAVQRATSRMEDGVGKVWRNRGYPELGEVSS